MYVRAYSLIITSLEAQRLPSTKPPFYIPLKSGEPIRLRF